MNSHLESPSRWTPPGCEVLGIRLVRMATFPDSHCPHSQWPALNPLLFSYRQPWFYGWGFNLPRGQALLEKWNLIPEGVDVLITHGPPLGKTHLPPPRALGPRCLLVLGGHRALGAGARGHWACPGSCQRVLGHQSPPCRSHFLSTYCVLGAPRVTSWTAHSQVVRSDSAAPFTQVGTVELRGVKDLSPGG